MGRGGGGKKNVHGPDEMRKLNGRTGDLLKSKSWRLSLEWSMVYGFI